MAEQNAVAAFRFNVVASVIALASSLLLACRNLVSKLTFGTFFSRNSTEIGPMSAPTDWKKAQSIHEFSATDIDGNNVAFDKYKGHTSIVVNMASQCGLTETNYRQLAEIQDKYGDSHGLKILAFPCNQFAGQEPGTSSEIKEFAKKYNAKFDMYSKIEVNGDNAHPLWKFLKSRQGGTMGDFIKWNFTKFIVNKDGVPVARYGPNTEPKKMEKDLLKFL